MATGPRFLANLHVRVTALFLGLLVVIGGVYYLWMTHRVFAPPAQDDAEERWYAELADVEVDSLASDAASDAANWQRLAGDYGEYIDRFASEVVFFDLAGRVRASSDPDSLSQVAGPVEAQMLVDMTDPDWAFDEIYPDPTNIDAYVNRIFHVALIGSPEDPQGYVAISWRPLIFAAEDVALDARKLWLQAVLVALAASFAVGWVLMTWLTRRIKNLSTAVGDLAGGKLQRRVDDQSPDDLGRLGRDFNTMAARIETLVQDLQGKEQFQRELIANISHDLRTPLASLRGYIETLSLSGRELPDEDYERYLGIVNNNIQHLDQLVDHLLQLSRLDAGQTRFAMEEFPLPELVDGVLARAEGRAAARNITLDCDAVSDLPLVIADPLQIAQVLQNLVENGIKFGHDGGQVVVIVRRDGDDRVSVDVHDDGPGIPREIQAQIFERFFTGDLSRAVKGQSSGLGLAIATKIVEGHGGRITVSSEPGQGACFRFQLQAAPELEAASAEG